ncbi:putative R3H and G-patch domain protein [Aspergillus homomorphus CBS 101889]|uniref:Protein SQS1 n=1 Tax=Aspergillus homomorphus (strain CBS 101889) TaxID=1450537 RepID=A0A395HLF7_ASPHC|nr:hypothetical protein BO97DRAFT_376609 [Aspergillus homomorphus CBS 101889]RAL08436.1 hypothetical protein BO97DRAFT_376609 [Aspergillus homomorphus CBS 101889]
MPRSKAKIRGKKSNTMVSCSPAHRKSHLTLQQEARNTEGRSSQRVDISLRHHAVQFISAGSTHLEQEQELQSPESPDRYQEPQAEDLSDAAARSNSSPEADHDVCRSTLPTEGISSTGTRDTAIRPNSAQAEDTSEDEVVFPGRRSQPVEYRPDKKMTTPATTNTSTATERTVPGTLRDSPDSNLRNVSSRDSNMTLPQVWSVEQALSECADYIDLGDQRSKKKKKKKQQKKDQKEYLAEEEAILHDYIANMDEEYLALNGECNKETGSEASAAAQTCRSPHSSIGSPGPADGEAPSPEDPPRQSLSKSRVDRVECDELDTTQSQSIMQYLDALDRKSIQLSDTDTDNPDEDRPENVALSDAYSNPDSADSIEWEISGHPTHLQRKHEEESIFASATAFADALDLDPYYGFDIMDFNRPSLTKKNKGKAAACNVNLSDSDLEAELLNAWETDRAKKKSRKQQREQLRSQGLLGRRNGEPDLKIKYAKGMNIDELKTEVRLFLLSTKESLVLPPMGKQQRKLVHELANTLSLNSQSRGKGSNRFPVMHKTSRTPGFNQRTLPQLERMLSKGKFSQRGGKHRDHKAVRPVKSQRGRPDASASYMDGEVVGASAPEIGAGNKGRAMLEKMGWSIGTPLGAINNKGILQPVAHVVKNSRTGLG